MPRIPRIVIPRCPHHVTQRGNRRQDVFFTDEDRSQYLDLLQHYSTIHGLAVQAYCLMSNHVHLVVVPKSESSLAGALKPLHMRYTQYLNARQGIGLLWQGRFFSCPLDETHLWTAVRYVERNPVRAGMVDLPWEYPWSSAAARCQKRPDPILSDPCKLTEQWTPRQWRQMLLEPWQDEKTIKSFLAATRTGRPAGTDKFIKRLERKTGRCLKSRPKGRPGKLKSPAGTTKTG